MQQSGPEILAPIFMFGCFGLIALFSIAVIVFWIWMIIDCATKEPSEGNDKLIWILVIVLAGWIGALIYFFFRRPTRIQRYGE